MECFDLSYLTEIDVSKCTKLTEIYCNDCNLTKLDVSGCGELQILECQNNNLTKLDVSGCLMLQTLKCYNNSLIAIDLSNNTSITDFVYADPDGNSNPIYFSDVLIDGQSYVPLSTLEPYGFDKAYVDASYIAEIDGVEYLCLGECVSELGEAKLTYTYDTGNEAFPAEFTIERKSKVTAVEINEANFPDPVFRNYIQENFDTDLDGILSPTEIMAVDIIDVESGGITSLEGISHFIRLNYLYCGDNNLTELDVSGCVELIELYCFFNNLTKLDVSGCTKLEVLYCTGNKLVALDLSNNPNLSYVDVTDNGNAFYDVIVDGKSYVPLTSLAAYGFDKERLYNQSHITLIGDVEYLCLGDCASADAEVSLSYKYDTGYSGNLFESEQEFTISRRTDELKNIILNASGYATYSNREPMTVSGAEAYTAEVNEEESILWLTPIGNVVPANTGVLLIGEPEAVVTVTPGGEAQAIAHNDFIATVTSTPVSEGTNPYVLSGGKFVRFTGENYSANKAHLELSADFATTDGGSEAKQMLIAIMPTAISSPTTTRRPASTTMYDLRGMRVDGKTKGIVIVNGKKVMPH